MNHIKSQWFTTFNQLKSKDSRLFTFPFSGAGAVIYQPWVKDFNNTDIQLVGVQLPGREARLHEPALLNLELLVEQLSIAILPFTNKPYSFFGHSLGGLVAFELSRKLRKLDANLPEHLFVSAFRAPDMINPNPILHRLSDHDLIEKMRVYGGTAEAIISNEDLMAILLPIIRADFTLFENYYYQIEPPLDVPITALSGQIDHVVKPSYMTDWILQTNQTFEHHIYEGDHFFLSKKQDEIVRLLMCKLLP